MRELLDVCHYQSSPQPICPVTWVNLTLKRRTQVALEALPSSEAQQGNIQKLCSIPMDPTMTQPALAPKATEGDLPPRGTPVVPRAPGTTLSSPDLYALVRF